MPYTILDRISSYEDVKKLDHGELLHLCGEIRGFLLENISKTGGHLASNLGIVEISVALARCLRPEDRIIYDVGHQCYVHKLLSGRRDRFSTLRTFGGMSGFMRPEESPADPFVTGHASNSISAALGLARAASLSGENRWTVAVIGDGAMTGGLAYEGLNDAGASGERILVVLNDNGMSIDENVGGLSRRFARFRIRRKYLDAKKIYHRIMNRLPGGERLNSRLTAIKNRVKSMFVQGSFFEQMGYTYIGPVDGNDVYDMCYALQVASEMKGPVLLHAVTKKGLGYGPSEKAPENYHGVGAFEPSVGCVSSRAETYSRIFGRELCSLAQKDPRICAVTAAMPAGCGLIPFREQFPSRFFDVGIAEEHAVTMAAGLAAGGMKPVFCVYSTFLQRGFDELIHDVSLMKAPVVFAIDRAGVVGADGETHHGLLDVGFLSLVPGMKIYFPSDFAELRRMLSSAFCSKGPVAIRYPRGGEWNYHEDSGKDSLVLLSSGSDGTLVSYGRMISVALETAELCRKEGISLSVYKINETGFDEQILCRESERTGHLFFLEETTAAASLRVALASRLKGNFHTRLFSFDDRFIPQGTEQELLNLGGLVPEKLVEAIKKEIS